MKRVFISGGAGFIGSHFVEKLLEDRNIETIMAYDNLSSGSLERIAHLMVENVCSFARETFVRLTR